MTGKPIPSPTISIVIPCRNSHHTLKQVLDVLSQLSPNAFEILLIDDGSEVSLEDIAREYGIRFHRIFPGQGPAQARNVGGELSQGDIILFLDSDVIPPVDIIAQLQYRFIMIAGLVAVQGIYNEKTPATGLFSKYQNYYYHLAFFSNSSDFPAICATYCFAIRRTVFLEMGGFDTRIPNPTVEDEIMGYRLMTFHHPIFLDRQLQVTHLAQYRIGSFFRRKMRMSIAQIKSLMRGNYPPIRDHQKNENHNQTHHSEQMIFSTGLAPLLPILWIIYWPSGLLITLIYCYLNVTFWRYLLHREPIWRLVSLIAITWLDQIAIFMGICIGALDFWMGRRY